MVLVLLLSKRLADTFEFDIGFWRVIVDDFEPLGRVLVVTGDILDGDTLDGVFVAAWLANMAAVLRRVFILELPRAYGFVRSTDALVV